MTTFSSRATIPDTPMATPLYREIKRRIMAALAEGEWKPGEAIPAERHLAERFGISIGTVRKAIDELVAENILIRQQGRGTFVASHTPDRLMFYFFHIVPEQGPKSYPDVQFIFLGRAKADRSVADKLGLGVGAPIFRIRNLLCLDGAPIIVDDIALCATRFAGLTQARFRDRESTIYNLYQEAFGVSVVRTAERLRSTLADAGATTLLDIARGTPVLEVRRVAYTYGDAPVEYRVSLVNTTKHEYEVDFRRANQD